MTARDDRTDTARRHDDHEMIDAIQPTPGQGGRSGGELQRDIGTRADEEDFIDGKTAPTRVRKADEKD